MSRDVLPMSRDVLPMSRDVLPMSRDVLPRTRDVLLRARCVGTGCRLRVCVYKCKTRQSQHDPRSHCPQENTCMSATCVPFSPRCNHDYEMFLAEKQNSAVWKTCILGYVQVVDITAPLQIGVTKNEDHKASVVSDADVSVEFSAWVLSLKTVNTEATVTAATAASAAADAPDTLASTESVRMPDKYVSVVKEHQRNVMRFAWRRLFAAREGGCVIAHGMGLGKTMDAVVLIAAFVRKYREHSLNAKALYIMPDIVITGLKAEMQRFDGIFHFVGDRTSKENRESVQVYQLFTGMASVEKRDVHVYNNFYKQVCMWHRTGGVMLINDGNTMSDKYAAAAMAFEPVEGDALYAKHKAVMYNKGVHDEVLCILHQAEYTKDINNKAITTLTFNNPETSNRTFYVVQFFTTPASETSLEPDEHGDRWVTRTYNSTHTHHDTVKKIEKYKGTTHSISRIEHTDDSLALLRALRVAHHAPTYTYHRFQPALLIVDEAHEHLNPLAQKTRALRTRESWLRDHGNKTPEGEDFPPMFFVATAKRVMMTGTPIPNTRTGLWHLMLITRGREGFPQQGCSQLQCETAAAFQKLFNKEHESTMGDNRALELARVAVLRHYFMRNFVDYKCQTDVLKHDLPPRSEFIINVCMSPLQVHMQRTLFLKSKEGGLMEMHHSKHVWTHPNFNNQWGADIPTHKTLYHAHKGHKGAIEDYRAGQPPPTHAPHFRVQFEETVGAGGYLIVQAGDCVDYLGPADADTDKDCFLYPNHMEHDKRMEGARAMQDAGAYAVGDVVLVRQPTDNASMWHLAIVDTDRLDDPLDDPHDDNVLLTYVRTHFKDTTTFYAEELRYQDTLEYEGTNKDNIKTHAATEDAILFVGAASGLHTILMNDEDAVAACKEAHATYLKRTKVEKKTLVSGDFVLCKFPADPAEQFVWYKGRIVECIEDTMLMSPKLTVSMNLVRACVERGERVVVMSESLVDLFLIQTQMVATRLGGVDWKRSENYAMVADTFNTTKNDERKHTVARMDDPDTSLRVAFMTKKIAGTGITINAFRFMILCGVSFTPGLDQQVMGRIYRYGQLHPVVFYRLIALDTVEEIIFKRQSTKGAMALRLLAGEREHVPRRGEHDTTRLDDADEVADANTDKEADDAHASDTVVESNTDEAKVRAVDPTLTYHKPTHTTTTINPTSTTSTGTNVHCVSTPQFADPVLCASMCAKSYESGPIYGCLLPLFSARAVHSVGMHMHAEAGSASAPPSALKIQREVALLRGNHKPPQTPDKLETWLCTVCCALIRPNYLDEDVFIDDSEERTHAAPAAKKKHKQPTIKHTRRFGRQKVTCEHCRCLFEFDDQHMRATRHFTRTVPVEIAPVGVVVSKHKTSVSIPAPQIFRCLHTGCVGIVCMELSPADTNAMYSFTCKPAKQRFDKTDAHIHTVDRCSLCAAFTLRLDSCAAQACRRCAAKFQTHNV